MSEPIVLPASGQPVRLRAPGLAVICVASVSDADRVTLSGAIEHAGGPAELVFAHPRGVACLAGELMPGAPTSEFRIQGYRPLDQRRETFRVGVTGRTRLTRGDRGTDEVDLKDLSAQGARVASTTAMELGEPLTVALDLEGHEIVVSGRVVRVDDRGYGIRFDPLSPGDDDRLSRFLTEKQHRRVRVRY